jgi:hypothetical protein
MGSRQGVAPRIARVCCSERLRATWPAKCSLCHNRLGLETTLRRNANRSPQGAMQLAAETEFCAWRLEVGTVARGRKPQSLQDFSCAQALRVPDRSATFMETENHAIPISCVVELRGFEPDAPVRHICDRFPSTNVSELFPCHHHRKGIPIRRGPTSGYSTDCDKSTIIAATESAGSAFSRLPPEVWSVERDG